MSFSELFCEKASLHYFSSFTSPDYHHQSSMSNSDFGELVWENGQILIKGGHSNKVSRVHNMDSFVNSKTGKPETSLGFDETVGGYDAADVIPWFYHLDDDVLHHESASGLVAETSGITSNGLRSFSNFSAAHQLSNPVKPSRVSSVGGNGHSNYAKDSGSLMHHLPEMRMQKKHDEQVQTFGTRATDRLMNQQTPVAKNGMLVDANANGQTDPSRKRLHSEPVEKQVKAMHPEDGLKGNQANHATANAQINSIDANKKTIEPTQAHPSLCSENSGLRASNNPTNHLKRKHSDEEDCESSSEDSEEDSISLRKTGCKRNRAAEVHNFNERKRREKINEKIRALQELIPNCNKVDKATMLDEAIEYLRLLQFQVQMMSMRSQIMPQPVMPMGFGMGMGYYQTQAALLDASPGFPALASCFPGSSNPHTQLWNAAQGLPVPMYPLPGLSVPMHGAQTTMITPQPSAENPNSMDPHLA